MELAYTAKEYAYEPIKAHATDAGIDLASPHRMLIPSGGQRMINTGIAVAIPDGHVGLLMVRSSVGTKKHLHLANSVGVIDAGYRGTIRVALVNRGRSPQLIQAGDRIVQLVIFPVPHVELTQVAELGDSDRSEGGVRIHR